MPDWTIHNEDCLVTMERMADASIDAIVTDPPFGIGYKYKQREVHNDPDKYFAWLRPRHMEMLRCLKPGGLFAMWQSQVYFRHLWDWFGNDIHIYCAAKNFVQIRPIPIVYGYDPVVMLYKPGAPPALPFVRRSIDYFVANTAPSKTSVISSARKHPCPRPIDAVNEIVCNFTPMLTTIYDPFVGSGTTGIVCVTRGRNFIGSEIEPEWADLSRERIAAVCPRG